MTYVCTDLILMLDFHIAYNKQNLFGKVHMQILWEEVNELTCSFPNSMFIKKQQQKHYYKIFPRMACIECKICFSQH